ncbi:MAG: TolC family protein [Bdellovibrionales bacterium]|nr:TolC family protein [Bdellovibrionales bacterium]
MSKILRSAIPGVLLLSVLHPQARADEAGLSLDGYLRRLKATHPSFAAQELRRDIASAEQRAVLGGEEWHLYGSAGYFYTEPKQNYFDQPEKAYGYVASAGAERQVWATGGRLAVRANHDQTNISPNTFQIPIAGETLEGSLGPGRLFETGGFVEYRQPLLKNFGGSLDRLQFELGGYAVEAESFQLQEAQEDFLLDIAHRFIDWELLTELRRIASRRVELAQTQRSLADRKLHENVIAEVDALRAQSDALSAKQALAELESQWEAKRAELHEILGDDLGAAAPAVSLYDFDEAESFEFLWAELEERSRLLRAIDAYHAQAVRQLQGAIENAKADLSIVATAGIRGDDKNWVKSAAVDRPDSFLGIEFRHPLGNTAAEASLARAKLRVEQISKERAATERALRAALRSHLERLSTLVAVLKIGSKEIRAAKAKTAEELHRYYRGEGDFTFVLQSQDAEQRSEERYIQTAASRRRVWLSLLSLLDRLL